MPAVRGFPLNGYIMKNEKSKKFLGRPKRKEKLPTVNDIPTFTKKDFHRGFQPMGYDR